MGRAIAHDLLRSQTGRVILLDSDPLRLESAGALLRGMGELTSVACDLRDTEAVHDATRDAALLVGSASYRLNATLAALAVSSGQHWVDLGGNTEVVEAILQLDQAARARGVCLAPDSGLQPGLGNLALGELFRELGGADTLRVLVGGIPKHPSGPLRYQLVFSAEGLLNEYLGPVRILREGRLTIVDPLSEVESLSWPGMPPLEAFHTSGSASTLPRSFAGVVDRLEVKTIRYAGHVDVLRPLLAATPADAQAALLDELLPHQGVDLILMRGEASREGRRMTFQLQDEADPVTGFSAMMRTTGFTAAIVAQVILEGGARPGALIQERDLPAREIVDRLGARGIQAGFSSAERAQR